MDVVEFKRIRVKLGLSQSDLAELLGMTTRNAVSNIEIGNRNPGKLTGTMLRVLDSLPKRKAEELVELMLKHGKET